MGIMKVGVIGLGDISTVYLNTLNTYPQVVELYGCACTSLEKARRKAKEFGFKKAYATGEELIADPEIDVVMNLTVPAFHYAYNLAALKAGKHVYSEKPLASTFAEGQEIMELAREKGLYVGCAPDTFMGGRLQTYRSLLDSGRLGQVIGGTACMVCHGWEAAHPNPAFYYQPGGGPLLDMGPYYLTALLSLLGPVRRVSGMASQSGLKRQVHTGPYAGRTVEVDPQVMTHVIANLDLQCGALIRASFSFDVWDSEMPRIELYGTKACLTITEPDPCDGPNLFGGQVLLREESSSRWLLSPRSEEKKQSQWEKIEVKHGHNSVTPGVNSRGIGLVDLALAVREGRKNRVSGEMALHALEVMEGILTSAKEHRFVEMTTGFDIPKPVPVDF